MSTANPYVELNLAIARKVAEEHAQNPNVCSIFVAGSVARGLADANSDVDMSIVLKTPMDADFIAKERQRAADSGGGFYFEIPDGAGFGIYRYVDGVKVDNGFYTVGFYEEAIRSVIDRHELDDLNVQLMIRGIRSSKPLYGADIVQRWIEWTDDYPGELQQKMIKQHLRFTPLWILRTMGVQRNDPFFLYEHFIENQKKILSVLYALNREYHPNKFKGLRATVEPLSIQPRAVLRRFEALFHLPLTDAVDDLERLMFETLDLVDQHCPDIDTKPTRAWLGKSFSFREIAG